MKFTEMMGVEEARCKKPGDPNAKSSHETKSEKKKKKDDKHKNKQGKDMTEATHEGVAVLDEVITKNLKKLETYAGVTEKNIQMGSNNVKFTFENSLKANKCQVVKYHDKYIVEFRKVTDNLLEGKMDQLVFEDVIQAAEFMDVFERVTGVYTSW